jgi:hypothetical protein
MLELITTRSLKEGWSADKTTGEINKIVAMNYDVMAAKDAAEEAKAEETAVVAPPPAEAKAKDAEPAATTRGRFGIAEARRFHSLCRQAIAESGLDERLYTAWKKAHDSRVNTLKARTKEDARTEILGIEGTAFEALQRALPQGSRIEAAVVETLAVSTDTNVKVTALQDRLDKQGETCDDTNARVTKILGKVCPDVITTKEGVTKCIDEMTPEEARSELSTLRVHHRFEQERMNLLRPKAQQCENTERRQPDKTLREIKVRYGRGSATVLPAGPDTQIHELKSRITAAFGIAVEATVTLHFGATLLTDGPIGDIIKNNKSTVSVTTTMPLKTIQIKQHGKEVIVLNVIASDTIDNVKVKIQEVTSIPPVKQRLVFAKQVLSIGTLASNNIQEAATLQLSKTKDTSGKASRRNAEANAEELEALQQTLTTMGNDASGIDAGDID